MLGSTLLKYFSSNKDYISLGTHRRQEEISTYSDEIKDQLKVIKDIDNDIEIDQLFNNFNPSIVINCIGVVKQLSSAYEPTEVIPINSLFPHRLTSFCNSYKARLIHFSTDCVFSGKKGFYNEIDTPDAEDLYGRSKLLGETYDSNSLTIRTSIIGHEIFTSHGLINWFLQQKDSIQGYKRAIFSGFPTIEIAKILERYVIPNKQLTGLYHLSSNPISKFDVLSLVAKRYNKDIFIQPNNSVVINRSLDSSKFQKATGFKPKCWKELVNEMYSFQFS